MASDVTPEAPGRYALSGEFGRGGQSRIFLARDEHVGREVAFKELLPGGADGGDAAPPDRVLRFLREARITGRLAHPSIVPVYEIGQRSNGTYYYTMKLVRGRTLTAALQQCEGFAERRGLLGHFENLCQAIAYAHEQHVIHRDLKPDNVMIGEFGETVVLDWGLAKATDSGEGEETRPRADTADGASRSPTLTADGTILGSPVYMSPEQARGKLDEVTEQSDVWGLGAVLYEILTGHAPFEGDTVMDVLMQLLDRPTVRPVRELAPEVPPELAAVCEKALQPDPARRFASARELRDEIAAWRAGRFLKSYRYSPWQMLQQLTDRYATAVRVGLAAFCIIVGILIYFSVHSVYQARESRVQRRAAESFANQLLFDFNDSVAPLPGSTAVRERLVASAMRYFLSRQESSDHDPETRLQLAVAYVKLGDIAVDLGHGDDARAVLEEAERILGSPPPARLAPTWWSARTLGYLRLGDLALLRNRPDEAHRLYQDASRMAASLPKPADVRLIQQALCAERLGKLALLQGALKESEQDVHGALDLLGQTTPARRRTPYLLSLAALYENQLGDVQATAGRELEARRSFHTALETARRLASRAPHDQEAQAQTGYALMRLGRCRAARDILQRLHEADPERWDRACGYAEAACACGAYATALKVARSLLPITHQEPDRRFVTLIDAAVAADLAGRPREASDMADQARRLVRPYRAAPDCTFDALSRALQAVPGKAARRVAGMLRRIEQARRAGAGSAEQIAAILEGYRRSLRGR